MGTESRGWHWGGWVGVVAIWLLTRRGGKADRAKGTEKRGGRGRGAHAGRATRSPSAERKSSGDLCVYANVCATD